MRLVSLCRVCMRWKGAGVRLVGPAPRVAAFPTASERVNGGPQLFLPAVRCLRSSAISYETDGEEKISNLLRDKLTPSYLQVRDISGGCGSMYEIVIDSEQFKGKRMILQHRMVNEALGKEVVKSLHGLTIRIGNPEAES